MEQGSRSCADFMKIVVRVDRPRDGYKYELVDINNHAAAELGNVYDGVTAPLYDALRHAKKQVDLVTLKHEDHWLSRGETRLQMLQASVDFLRANNPPD
jgi:hypothetical protein